MQLSSENPGSPASLGLQRGEVAEVRGLAEIRATLDERGALDGIPFMPEMERFAGRRARVWRRADRLCVEGASTHRRLSDTVFLEDLRCDGSAHAGCQRACLLLWNEAWLRRPGDPPAPGPKDAVARTAPAEDGSRYFCQSTALLAASTPMPVWHPAQYLRDLLTRNLTLSELTRSMAGSLANKVKVLAARRTRAGRPAKTPSEALGLSVGDWVQVKTLEEIEATLDARQTNRGLEFSPAMVSYCGRRFRVGRRVERIILERTGEMRDLKDTVVLETVFCDGICARGCPRANVLYWREIWLRRVEPSGP
ncbi:MAG TPA: hypothetical protein VN915_11190 [Elusimicrobiota bacterium]|nr:hypothetical protein [Elusimicrobiota bacterium]